MWLFQRRRIKGNHHFQGNVQVYHVWIPRFGRRSAARAALGGMPMPQREAPMSRLTRAPRAELGHAPRGEHPHPLRSHLFGREAVAGPSIWVRLVAGFLINGFGRCSICRGISLQFHAEYQVALYPFLRVRHGRMVSRVRFFEARVFFFFFFLGFTFKFQPKADACF